MFNDKLQIDFLEINYLDLNALDSVVEEVVVDFVDYNQGVLLEINAEEPLMDQEPGLVQTRYLLAVEYFEDWGSRKYQIHSYNTFTIISLLLIKRLIEPNQSNGYLLASEYVVIVVSFWMDGNSQIVPAVSYC